MDTCRELRRVGGGNYPLPPPPPPPPPLLPLCPHGPQFSRRPRNRLSNGSNVPWWKAWMKKYVVLCLVCGGLSVVLGIVLIVIYLLLRSYTSSLQFFETVPTYVPGVVLIITGLIVMCFAKRKNRYAYLIKLAGGCCLICALLCVVITVTTTVVHMNRLQTLHECVYTPQAKTCMCVSAIADHTTQDAHRFVFNNTPNCEVVHGSLYSCLRALFSFSVIGILVCIFSSMLVYQLLSHEKKKVYWQQLELRRRFLYQRNPHHAVCGCYEDLYPWQLWEMLDYRFLTSHSLTPTPISGEEESPPQSNTPATRNVGLGGGGHRASGWNWLPWPRQDSSRRNPSSNRSSNPSRQSFMRRLMSRDTWNQQLLTLGSCSPEESSNQMDSPGVSPWRSECIHIFRPSPRNNNCVPPIRFGIRARNSPYGRPQGGHRRTRSNDGVFHHLHMAPRYTHPYPLTDANNTVTCHFSNCEIPRYMWGPPPPYSHPPSIENIPACDGNVNHNSRRSSGSHDPVNGGIEISHCEQVITTLEPSGTGTLSSKSTPLSERRYMCHNFSSEGITLTIGSNFSDICSQDGGNKEHKSEEKCIVEVHVPYILHRNNIVFNTLPARSCRKKEINPFKSLSNIPLCLSHRLNSLKQEKNQTSHLSIVQNFCSHKDELNCPLNKVDEDTEIKPRFCNVMTLKTLSEQQLYEGNSTNTSPVTETSPSSLSYHPTMVEIPSDFRSSLVIATSPSTPVTENPTLTDMIYAQSMPNLSLSNSQTICSIHRVPSSGNTSTSQDFADFELEEDSSPVVLCSPISDIPPPPSLPDDSNTDSSSSYYPCPPPFNYMEDNEVPFSNESSIGSQRVTVSCFKKHYVLPVISNSSAGSSEFVSDTLNKTNEVETDRELISSVPSSHSNHPVIPFSSSSSVTVNDSEFQQQLTNCGIHHHHHHHHPKQKATRGVPENARGTAFCTLSQERTNNFVVTIKSVNV